jgi:N-acetylmuramic acid 6-phosphate (MurNAc-6-P) etherase
MWVLTILEKINLRQSDVMVNHFVSATGCHAEQAKQCLAASNWQFQVNIVKIFNIGKAPGWFN